jgi:hypothetical protein
MKIGAYSFWAIYGKSRISDLVVGTKAKAPTLTARENTIADKDDNLTNRPLSDRQTLLSKLAEFG